jgi:hypothetical protein
MHEDLGSKGWRLQGQPDFDPLGGMAVAHDILEHFPHGDGSPADELQALGASLWLRDGYSAGENVGSDLPEVMAHVIYQDMRLGTPPTTRPCDADGEINIAIKCMMREAEYQDAEWKRSVGRYKSEIRGWMRIGYRRVQRRYRNVYQGEMLSAFQQIETEADKYLKYAEEGQRLEVQLTYTGPKDYRRPVVRVKLIEYHEEY